MPLLDLISRICVSLSVTNLFLALFFFKKYKNTLSKTFFQLILVNFINIFFLGAALYIISAIFPQVIGYENIFLIGFMINISSIFLMVFVLRNLYFLGVNEKKEESIRILPFFLGTVLVMTGLFFIIRDKNLLFHILSIMMISTGVLHIISYIDLLTRFIKDYTEIQSYVIRKASLFIFILGGVFIPILYSILILDYLFYGSTKDLTRFIYETINNSDLRHTLMYNVSVLSYHLLFHSFSIFYIARYYFRSNDDSLLAIDEKQAIELNLSRREVEIANLMLRGLKNKNIREKLFIADGTLRNHITNIYQKTNVKSREEFLILIQNHN